MKIRVSTTEYEFSHGRKPRGRGSWAFDLGAIFPKATLWFCGTYTEALKSATRAAKEHKVDFVKVLP